VGERVVALLIEVLGRVERTWEDFGTLGEVIGGCLELS